MEGKGTRHVEFHKVPRTNINNLGLLYTPCTLQIANKHTLTKLFYNCTFTKVDTGLIDLVFPSNAFVILATLKPIARLVYPFSLIISYALENIKIHILIW